MPFIDLRDSFAGETDMRQVRMSREDYHPNARGHHIMADKLYSAILADRELSEAILGYVPGRAPGAANAPGAAVERSAVLGTASGPDLPGLASSEAGFCMQVSPQP